MLSLSFFTRRYRTETKQLPQSQPALFMLPNFTAEIGNSASKQPAGQISKFLSSPFCKNILVFRIPESVLEPRLSRPTERRLAIVTNAGRDAVDAAASARNVVAGRSSDS
jgi:hypothetical protein